MRVPVVVSVVAAMMFAGCVTGDDPTPTGTSDPIDATVDGKADDTPSDGTGGAAEEKPLELVTGLKATEPEWETGRWWTWSIQVHENEVHTVTTVVLANATGYTIGATDADEGVLARYYHVVPMGTLEDGTLAWEEHDEPFRLTAFPMTADSSWKGETWARPELTFIAKERALEGPDGELRGFHVVGRDEKGTPAVSFEWAPGLGFLAIGQHYGADDPIITARVTATGVDEGRSGHSIEVDDPSYSINTQIGGPSSLGWTIPRTPRVLPIGDDVTHILGACELGGKPGVYGALFVAPSQETYECKTVSSGEGAYERAHLLMTGEPGDWVYQQILVGQGRSNIEVMLFKTAPMGA
ncbi:MAG: hypothetical protein KY455_12995 [Euryarchaeota archaeon]|nr:hypothetical protein [Euryarchaeota archaeon]